MRLLCLALCGVLFLDGSPAENHGPQGLEAAFDRLYNFDFAGSREAATRYLAENGDDPMGFTALAAGYLYGELHRLNALGTGFPGDKRVSGGKALKPDAAIRTEFWKAVTEARKRAKAALDKNPNHRHGLLVMSITTGLERDYLALIDNKYRQSLESIRQSYAYSRRLLAVDGQAHDAYLNTGFTEYLLGSFPAMLRWLVRIEGVTGDKVKGLGEMEIAARSGQWMKPLAQLMLASFYQREKRPKDSQRLLREMARNYPRNAVIRRELEKIDRGTD